MTRMQYIISKPKLRRFYNIGNDFPKGLYFNRISCSFEGIIHAKLNFAGIEMGFTVTIIFLSQQPNPQFTFACRYV